MKKYLKLTSQEAMHYFIHKDGTLAPETSEEIRKKVSDLYNLKSELSVSITMPTHRIFPDTDKDKVMLKNLINEAEQKLSTLVDKRKVKEIMENIEEANDSIDLRLNLDSLVLYANEHFSSVVKLPVTLHQEVIIDPFFDIRPLYKSLQQNQRYYILTVSRQKIRLLEAFNDKITVEYNNEDFPFINNDYYTTNPVKIEQDIFEENLIKEFFNDADKRFRKYLLSNPLPIILVGDVKSVSYYKEMMDNSDTVIAYVNGNYDNAPTHEIIQVTYPIIKQYNETQQSEYLSEISNAKSDNLLSTDINEMYILATNGNTQTLFIGENYNIEGTNKENRLSMDLDDDKNKESSGMPATLSLLDTIRGTGGRIIFLDDILLEEYNGIVMVKRF